MRVRKLNVKKLYLAALFLLLTPLVLSNKAIAASHQLTWTDNSTNEVGFKIDRKTGATGTYALLATVTAGTTSYTDTTAVAGTTYCYRVYAYNAAGNSPFTPDTCGSAPAVQSFTLTVAKAGTGTGVVKNATLTINCGTDCSEAYSSGALAGLTATQNSGSTFAGWNPVGCGNATMTANITCTATFNLVTPTTVMLTVAKAGTGTGVVKNANLTINCGSDCSEAYPSGSAVALTATPATGSSFAGWNTQACASYTISANMNCVATFNLQTTQPPPNSAATRIGLFRPSTGEWFLDVSGNGMFDNCTIDRCITKYGRPGMLPVAGDWFGTGKSHIGAYDPHNFAWHLDDGDGQWGACGTNGDFCITSFGRAGALPVVRDLGTANKLIVGMFQAQYSQRNNRGQLVTKQGVWKFDADGDGVREGCAVDDCIENFGIAGDLPVTGDWNQSGADEIGVFRPSNGRWYLDLNGNGKWDGSIRDKVLGPFGQTGDLPVVGDWDGTGKIRIGVYRPTDGKWYLDLNGNGAWDNCTVDACLGPFGQQGDLPVVGNW